MPERLNAPEIARRMPPASSPAIPAPGLKALNDWLTAGAKPVAQGCPITEKASTTMPTPETGGPTSTRSGGATDVAQTYNDPMMKCYEFRAHNDGDKTKAFTVSTQPDMYTNFTFMPPWQGMMYARSFRILDGNDAVIHHWLFYKNAAPVADGAVGFSSGAHPDGELVHGWAPGGSNLYFDPDVGLEMPSSVGYTLETHHNNTTGTPAPDNSGLEVCVTSALPKNVVSLSWLGTDNINGTTATGTCAPAATEPIHIIGISPHMHTKGTHMSALITRAGGKTEMLHDAPFDFNNQHSYNALTTLMPGDSIKTTCTYNSPVRFGEGTGDEMCYLFTLYYPKLSLTNGNPVGTLIHGPNTCLQ
jgi:hypothetical protein